MKVLIKKTNQIKEVKDGYALNYLFPQGLAILASQQVLDSLNKQKQQKQEDDQVKQDRLQKLAQDLEGKKIFIKAKTNEEGELYGSIGEKQIKKVLKIKEKVNIKINQPFKKVGKYPVDIKLGSFKANINLEIRAS